MTEAQRNMISAAQDPDSLLTRSMSVLPPDTDPNSRLFHAHEQPAGSGITNARSLARMYASLIGDGVDGIRILNDETIARATTEQASGLDRVVAVQTRFDSAFSSTFPSHRDSRNTIHSTAPWATKVRSVIRARAVHWDSPTPLPIIRSPTS